LYQKTLQGTIGYITLQQGINMPRSGTGQYFPPTNTWSPSINGVLATAGDWQQLLDDLAAALTQSVSRDGQTPMTGNLALGNNKITGLTAGTGTGEALAFQQLFNQGTMADIASAGTTDIGVQNTNFLRVTGNTTITSFGTNYRGPRFLVFEQNITLTNSSTLVLLGGANLAVTAGDALIVIPGATLGTADKWVVVAYRKNAIPLETALTATSSGNLGLGVTPSAWTGSGGVVLEIGRTGNAIFGSGTLTTYSYNANFNSGWKYSNTGLATRYVQNGAHEWYIAPSGTAGNAISFTQAMTLDTSGNLGIGTTSPYSKLDLGSFGNQSQLSWHTDATTSYGTVAIQNSSAAIGLLSALKMGATANSFASAVSDTWAKSAILLDYGNIKFFSNPADTVAYGTAYTPTERARIDSSGNLIQSAPTTPPLLATNGQMVFNLTSNTNLRVSVRGSDGVTRTANITLS
jgi:hypothetical protein